jgi:hypothetical protein
VKLPTVRSKHFDTIVHAVLSSVHACGGGYDVALYFNVGVSPVTWVPRLAGQRVVLNVDGLDWKRKKWGAFARAYIRSCERWAARCPHRVVTDSRRGPSATCSSSAGWFPRTAPITWSTRSPACRLTCGA